MGQYLRLFNDKALFTPRILTYSCPGCEQKVKDVECLSNGTYCAYRPKTPALLYVPGIDDVSGKALL